MTRWLKPIIGLSITVIFLFLLLQNVDLQAVGHAFTQLSFPILTLAITFLAFGYSVRIARWWFMLRTLEPSLPFKACIWPFLTSIAVNNIMPFRAGDMLRTFGFRQQLRSPVVRVLGTLILERIFDLVTLLGFFFLGLVGMPPGVFPEQFVIVGTWLAVFSIIAILLLMLLTPWLEHIINKIAAYKFFVNRNLSQGILDHGGHFIAALEILRSLPRFLILLGLSILTWIFEGAVFATVAVAIEAGSSPLGPWFSMATGTLGTLIPSSPGYVGTFDYFVAQGLQAYGGSSEISVAFALTVHAVLWTPLTVAGLIYLILHGKRFWTIKPATTSTTDQEASR